MTGRVLAQASQVFAVGIVGGIPGVRQPASADPEAQRFATAYGLLLLVGFLLVVVFLLGSYIAVRVSRRVRAESARKRALPTPTEDVWSMHRLPDDEDYCGPTDRSDGST